jgi:hypothetical protein
MLTRFARHFPLLALLGCAAHRTVPAPAPVCAPPKTDSLHIDVTDRADSDAAARVRPCGAEGWPAIVHVIDPRAARDALDSGIDALITADPQAVAYAATRPDYESTPLSWDRLYLLVLPKGRGGSGGGDDLRDDLATNAVRVDARPAQSHGCGAVAPVLGPGSHARIVYADNDSVARALAERLVALAPRPGDLVPLTLAQVRDTIRALGVPADSLAAAVATGGDVGYVVSVPFPALSGPCPDAPGIVPLIETRPHAIVRRASP